MGRGVLTLWLIWPWCNATRRHALIRNWAAKLLRLLRLTVQVNGPWPVVDGPFLLTSNHISWVDIFIILSVHPVRFISKSEVRQWPLLGWLAAKTGTLFIDRSSKRQTLEIGRAMSLVLSTGEDLGLFPESTTSTGEDVLPFKTSLLQAPLDCNATLLPVALRYHHPLGETDCAYPFVGDMTFMDSLRRILRSPPCTATLSPGLPCNIHALGTDRRQIAHNLHTLTRELALRGIPST